MSLFRQRDFVLLFAARSTSMLGYIAGPMSLAFGVLRQPGASAGDVSVVLAASGVCLLAFVLVGGVLADRLPRRLVVFWSGLLGAAAWGTAAGLLMSGNAPLWALTVASGLTGTANAVQGPTFVGLVPEIVPVERLQQANALMRFGGNVIRLGGVAVAGVAIETAGAGPTIAGIATVYLLSSLMVLALRAGLRPWASASAERSGVVADLREGWREFASREWLWVIVAQFTVMTAAMQATYGVLGPVIAERELGGPSTWSAILSGQAAGMLVGVVIAVRVRVRRPMLVATLMTGVWAVPVALLGVRAPIWLVVAGSFVAGIAVDVFSVLWETALQRFVPPAALSRVSSYDILGSLLLGPVGLLLAGPLELAVGARTGVLICAIVVLATTGAALLSRDVRCLVWPADSPVTSALALGANDSGGRSG